MWRKITNIKCTIEWYCYAMWRIIKKVWRKWDVKKTNAIIYVRVTGYKSRLEKIIPDSGKIGRIFKWRFNWTKCLVEEVECI